MYNCGQDIKPWVLGLRIAYSPRKRTLTKGEAVGVGPQAVPALRPLRDIRHLLMSASSKAEALRHLLLDQDHALPNSPPQLQWAQRDPALHANFLSLAAKPKKCQVALMPTQIAHQLGNMARAASWKEPWVVRGQGQRAQSTCRKE